MVIQTSKISLFCTSKWHVHMWRPPFFFCLESSVKPIRWLSQSRVDPPVAILLSIKVFYLGMKSLLNAQVDSHHHVVHPLHYDFTFETFFKFGSSFQGTPSGWSTCKSSIDRNIFCQHLGLLLEDFKEMGPAVSSWWEEVWMWLLFYHKVYCGIDGSTQSKKMNAWK